MREVEKKGFEEETEGSEPLGNEAFPWKVCKNCFLNPINHARDVYSKQASTKFKNLEELTVVDFDDRNVECPVPNLEGVPNLIQVFPPL